MAIFSRNLENSVKYFYLILQKKKKKKRHFKIMDMTKSYIDWILIYASFNKKKKKATLPGEKYYALYPCL